MGFPAKGLLPHPHPAPSQGRTLTWTRCRPRPHGRQLLEKNDADYDIVSERRSPHPGPCEFRCEGLCGVQCAIWGRRKAAQAGPPLGHCRGKNQVRISLMQRRASLPQAQPRQWPFKAPGALHKVRAKSQSIANSRDWRGGDLTSRCLSLRGCFPHTEEVRLLGLSASRGWCQETTSEREGGKCLQYGHRALPARDTVITNPGGPAQHCQVH